MDKLKAFQDVLNSDEGKEILALGEKIKKLDKSNDKRMMLIILLSMVSMTLLGYFAFGIFGAVLFFAITAIASFWLYYSSKKNVLLKYLTFYRTRVPKMIASADGVDVAAEEIPDSELVSTLSDKGKLEYRMCHRYGDLYIGYAKFMSSGEPILQGIVYCCDGVSGISEGFLKLLEENFDEHSVKVINGKALLYLPWVNDYLNGRVEMKDDLSFPSLVRQYDYYLLGKRFKAEVNGEKTDDMTVFHEVE